MPEVAAVDDILKNSLYINPNFVYVVNVRIYIMILGKKMEYVYNIKQFL